MAITLVPVSEISLATDPVRLLVQAHAVKEPSRIASGRPVTPGWGHSLPEAILPVKKVIVIRPSSSLDEGKKTQPLEDLQRGMAGVAGLEPDLSPFAKFRNSSRKACKHW